MLLLLPLNPCPSRFLCRLGTTSGSDVDQREYPDGSADLRFRARSFLLKFLPRQILPRAQLTILRPTRSRGTSNQCPIVVGRKTILVLPILNAGGLARPKA